MSVNTAQLRTYGETVPACFPNCPITQGHVPTFEWSTSANKKYTLLFVDLLQTIWPTISGSPTAFFVHGIYANLIDNNVKADPAATYLPPGNPLVTPNHYTYLLFEHDSDISGVRTGNETTFGELMVSLGLAE